MNRVVGISFFTYYEKQPFTYFIKLSRRSNIYKQYKKKWRKLESKKRASLRALPRWQVMLTI